MSFLRLNEKYRPAAPAPAPLQSVNVLVDGSSVHYSFALEKEVLERKDGPRHSFVETDVRFRGGSKRLKLPRMLQGSSLMQKLRSVCGQDEMLHVEVNGKVLVKMEEFVEFSDNDVIEVATIADGPQLVDDESIPCDKCGKAVQVSIYLEHEKNCK